MYPPAQRLGVVAASVWPLSCEPRPEKESRNPELLGSGPKALRWIFVALSRDGSQANLGEVS